MNGSAELEQPSSDETGATTAANSADDRALTKRLTKLVPLVDDLCAAIEGGDAAAARAVVERLRDLL